MLEPFGTPTTTISKQLVAFAQEHGCGIRMEDLTGIRTTVNQGKATKSQAEHNCDFRPGYDLETKTAYKAFGASVAFEKIPAPYTSKSCCKCGAIGERNRHGFKCKRCGYQGHADHHAGRNISRWSGLSCPLVLHVPMGGVMVHPQARHT